MRHPQRFRAVGLPKTCWPLLWALDAEVSRPDRINKAAL